MNVDAIKSKKDISTIKTLLKDNKRDLFIFVLGINSGIRMGDLVSLRVNQFLNKSIGETITITENKTGKTNFITINKAIHTAFNEYYDTGILKENDYLFKSRKKGFHLHPNSVYRLVIKWCNQINLKGNYGNHTLRKTFGYHQRFNNNVGIEHLMQRFNHSSQAITLRYIGISQEDIQNICMNDI